MSDLDRWLGEAEERCRRGALSRPTEDKYNVYHPAIRACHEDLPRALRLVRIGEKIVWVERELRERFLPVGTYEHPLQELRRALYDRWDAECAALGEEGGR